MTRRIWPALSAALLTLSLATPARSADADPAPLLARITAVKAEGAGNADAAKAWRDLVALGPKALAPTLLALDGADATAANWLRSAVDAVAEKELTAGRPLPADKLEAYLKDTKHSPLGRRLAYEWLTRVDKTTPDRLLPGLLHDPSVELRRDAVAVVLKDAQARLDKDDKTAARAAFEKALSGARDRDQVDLIARELEKLGTKVDVAAHFGFVRAWHLIGPFDSADGKGYAAVFPPEEKIDLKATYKGKGGAELRWVAHTTKDAYGNVDLNKALAKHMGAAAYACAVVASKEERPVEVRAGTTNAVKVFLNGKLLSSKEEYHHGKYMDQHVGSGTLKAGRNTLLVKVCQNEQTDAWAQEWDFQLRVCDAVGTPVPLTLLPE